MKISLKNKIKNKHGTNLEEIEVIFEINDNFNKNKAFKKL